MSRMYVEEEDYMSPQRQAVAGVATFNARLPTMGKQQSTKRPKAMHIKVTYVIRPGLLPSATSVLTLPMTSRTQDVLLAAWAELQLWCERKGSLWGPLPSPKVEDYCLCFVDATGRLGDACPDGAVFERLFASRAPKLQDGTADPPPSLGGTLNTLGAKNASHSSDPLVRKESMLDRPSTNATSSYLDDDNYIPHVVLVVRPVFLLLEKLIASETATRQFVATSERQNFLSIENHERESRALQAMLEAHAKALALQRAQFCRAEATRRALYEARYDEDTAQLALQFKKKFSELEYGMLAQYNHLCNLRQRYQEDVQRIATQLKSAHSCRPVVHSIEGEIEKLD